MATSGPDPVPLRKPRTLPSGSISTSGRPLSLSICAKRVPARFLEGGRCDFINRDDFANHSIVIGIHKLLRAPDGGMI